jgi:hypothetical protein
LWQERTILIYIEVNIYYRKQLRRTFLASNISILANDSHLAEGQFLNEEQTLNNAKSLIYRAGTQRPTISKMDRENFKPK